MSLERIIKALIDNGLTRIQAEVYVYLAKKGPKTVEHLKRTLIYNKKEIKQSLNHLQINGLVTQNRILFCALPFEEALTLLIETRKEEAQIVTKKKEGLLANWKEHRHS